MKEIGINSEKCIEYGKYSNSQTDKPQRGRPKRAELPDVNINTGAQSIHIAEATFLTPEMGRARSC